MACEHGSDPSSSIKTWNFLTSYANISFAKKGFAAWDYSVIIRPNEFSLLTLLNDRNFVLWITVNPMKAKINVNYV